MQNVHNGNPANSTFRIGKHDVGGKLDIGSDGYLNAAGARLGGEISTGSNATINGRASFGGPMSEGIVNIRNRDGRYTHFNWPDGQNYIRGNTIIDGLLLTPSQPLFYIRRIDVPRNTWAYTDVPTSYRVISASILNHSGKWEEDDIYTRNVNGRWAILGRNNRYGHEGSSYSALITWGVPGIVNTNFNEN
jgi:hypothetical protein